MTATKHEPKLVRDKILERIEGDGLTPLWHELTAAELPSALGRKLAEEAREAQAEFMEGSRTRILEELGDCREVRLEIMCRMRIKEATVSAMRESQLHPLPADVTSLAQLLVDESVVACEALGRYRERTLRIVVAKLASIDRTLDALMKLLHLSGEEVEAARLAKLEKNGGFKKRIFLEEIVKPKSPVP